MRKVFFSLLVLLSVIGVSNASVTVRRFPTNTPVVVATPDDITGSSGAVNWGDIQGIITDQADLITFGSTAYISEEVDPNALLLDQTSPQTVANGAPIFGAGLSTTSVNKVVITAPDTSATLTIVDGKTLTVTNTVDLNTMTDEQICNYEGTGTQINCDITLDASGSCAAGSICSGGHTHPTTEVSGVNTGTDLTADLEEEAHAAEHAVGGADTVFPADPGADRVLMWDDDPGALAWVEAGGAEVNNLETITTGIAIDEVPVGTDANTVVYKAITDCDNAGNALNYDTTGHAFSCKTLADADIPNDITINTATNAGTATVATTVTITDNESTAENNPLVFVADADPDGGNLGLESDGTAYYTPSTGVITATGFAGALTGTASGNLISGGTLTSANVCQYDGSGIDCDLTKDGTGDCASGAVCLGGHTHATLYGPIAANYLVGTANATLTGEIAVGTSPGGELGGTWVFFTIDDSVTVTGWVMGASTATTPSADDNDTSLATTAYVQTELNAAGGRSLTCSSGSCDADAELYTVEKCIIVETPTDADNFLMFRSALNSTITSINCIVEDATSAVITIQECDTAGDNCAGADGVTTITCDVDGQADDGSLSNASIDATDWIRLDIGTVTGTVAKLTACITMTRND